MVSAAYVKRSFTSCWVRDNVETPVTRSPAFDDLGLTFPAMLILHRAGNDREPKRLSLPQTLRVVTSGIARQDTLIADLCTVLAAL